MQGFQSGEVKFYDLSDSLATILIEYRDNGKKIQVRTDKYKSGSTCYKTDVFNFNKGFDLAVKRLIVKHLDGQVKHLASSM